MRVLIAENDRSFRDLLKAIIEREPSLTLVGIVDSDEEAVQLARDTMPDVVLLDVRMLGGGGVRAAGEIRRACPGVRILALSGSRDRERVIEMQRAGAIGYLLKAAPPGEILRMLTDSTADNVIQSADAANERRTGRDDPAEHDAQQIASLLEEDRINVVLQPVFDLKLGTIAGYEALARFAMEPKAAPDVWFRRADAVGLRIDLEFAVLARALPLATSIPDKAFLAVNLSPTAVMSDRCETAFWNSQPDRVVIELTEHLPVRDYPAMRDRLADLRAMGMRVSIDDVGAGFASLRHILELSPDFIKLDISLIRHIDNDSPRRSLATALITYGHELHAAVIAEGVETRQELEVLQQLGVGFGQGFFLARPSPFIGPSPSAEAGGRIRALIDAAVAAIGDAESVGDAMRGLADELSPHLPLDHVSLGVFTQPSLLNIVALWDKGKASMRPGTSVSAVATPFPEVVRRDGPVSSSDPGVYHPLVEQVLREEGIRSWVSVPLHRSKGIPAMLSFGSRDLDAFDEVKVDTLARIGAAIEQPLLGLPEDSPSWPPSRGRPSLRRGSRSKANDQHKRAERDQTGDR